MSLPGGLTTITVTGTYTDATGTAQAGSVSFTPTSTVFDAAGTTVLTETAVVATLNSSGHFSLGPIPTTDNSGLTPLRWAYSIAISVAGAQATITPVYISSAFGSTVDITQLSASTADPSPSGISYLPNAGTPPADAPTLGGGFLYASGGALYWFGSSGTRTRIAPS
jgi:hypothetical protein